MNSPRKVVVLIAVMLLSIEVRSQNHQYIVDSAEFVVKQYLKRLNFDAIKPDSMLYIESYIYNRETPTDTLVMKRWHVEPSYYRAELWHGDTLIEGLYSNAKDRFRHYDGEKHKWEDITMSEYYDKFGDYDYREPLYHWRSNGSEMTYQGIWKLNGAEAYRIYVQSPSRYDRRYLFEKESGLLFLIEELEEHSPDMATQEGRRKVDWRAIHEFQPVGEVLFPSIESYQSKGTITFIFHTFKYIPRNLQIFVNDEPLKR